MLRAARNLARRFRRLLEMAFAVILLQSHIQLDARGNTEFGSKFSGSNTCHPCSVPAECFSGLHSAAILSLTAPGSKLTNRCPPRGPKLSWLSIPEPKLCFAFVFQIINYQLWPLLILHPLFCLTKPTWNLHS